MCCACGGGHDELYIVGSVDGFNMQEVSYDDYADAETCAAH